MSSTNASGSANNLITVFGITGNQGSSVALSLLANKSGTFRVRGISRNASSPKAKELASLGAEIVTADALAASVDELAKVLEGSWGFFGNINGDDETLPSELDLGKKLVDAAVKAGVQHFVYSGMESASKITGGKIPVQAFDDKNAVFQYASAQPSFLSVTSVSPGWYMENFLVPDLAPLFGGFPYHHPENKESGAGMIFTCPTWGGNEEIPFISITTDYGDIVHGAFISSLSSSSPSANRPKSRQIQALSTSSAMSAAISSFAPESGCSASYVPMPLDSLQTFGMKAMETVKGMFSFCQASGGRYYGVPNDTSVAAEMKSMAVLAKGMDVEAEEAKLMGFETFWQTWFGQGRKGWMEAPIEAAATAAA